MGQSYQPLFSLFASYGRDLKVENWEGAISRTGTTAKGGMAVAR
jgi:hypothetical protein